MKSIATLTRLFVIFLSAGVLGLGSANAAPPGVINHQGRIAVAGVNLDGSGHFKFALVDGAATETFWSNDDSGLGAPGGEPTDAVKVVVTKGHYSIPLGDTTFHSKMNNSIPAEIFAANDDLRLRVWFSTAGDPGTFELLTPDRRLTSSGFALSAATAVSVSDGAVNKLDSPDGSLTGLVSTRDGGAVIIGDSSIEPVTQLIERGSSPIGEALDIVVRGDFAYVAGTGELRIFEVSDPDAIVARGVESATIALAVDVEVDGDYAFVVDRGTGHLRAYNVSDPVSIVAESVANIPTSVFGAELLIDGDYAYVSVSDGISGRVFVYDVSDPAIGIPIVGSIFGISPGDIAIAGNSLCVLDRPILGGARTLKLFDISDPTNPVAAPTDSIIIPDPRAISVDGHFAFVTDGGSIRSYDVSDPSNIVERDSDSTGLSFPRGIALQGGTAVVVDPGTLGLHSFNVSDPADLRPSGTVGGLTNPVEIAVAGGFAYVADSDAGAEFFKIYAIVQPRATVDGTLHVSGSLVDSEGEAGGAGQVLSSASSGTEWVDLLDNDPANELQQLSFDGTLLNLSDGGGAVSIATLANAIPAAAITSTMLGANSVGSSEIATGAVGATEIASNAVGAAEIASSAVGSAEISANAVGSSEIATGAVAGSEILNGSITGADITSSTLGLSGDLEVGSGSSTDDDSIYFDNGISEVLRWSDSNSLFFLSDQLVVGGPISAGGTINNSLTLGYNNLSSAAPSPEAAAISDGNDVYVGDDLEVDGFLYLNDRIYMGEAEGDQSIYFYDNGINSSERLFWDDSLTDFVFTDNVRGTSFINTSDRNAKAGFEEIDTRAILDRVAELPITRWIYRSDPEGNEHIGPVAQDFRAAFGLGEDDKTINTVDADGIALAAIQALKAENDALKKQNQSILERLERIEQLIESK